VGVAETVPGDEILIDAMGAQSGFEHRRNDLPQPVAQAARAGDRPGGALRMIADTLELLMRPQAPLGPRRKQQKPDGGTGGKKPHELLMEQGILEIEALCYIRGRPIPGRFFVLDEAQQLTPQEAKTVVTRM
jgi:hypothetical protein